MAQKKNPDKPSLPDKINPDDYKDKPEHSGTIIVGDKKPEPGYIVNGGAYDKDGNLMNNQWGNGQLDVSGGKWESEYIPNGNNTGGTAVFKPVEEDKKKPSNSGSGSSGGSSSSRPDPPPPPPPKIEWTEPFPTLKNELKQANYFTYFFGVDEAKVRSVILHDTCCFVSSYNHVGALQEDEYIELDATYDIGKYSSIEFYIVDGEMEIPIVPIKDSMVRNEKIFQGLRTRFEIDESVPPVISYNGTLSNVELSTAIERESGYTVTYKPANGYTYRPFNEDVKVKVIIRSYAEEGYVPQVTSIKIRKYGGNVLWK